MPAVVDHFFRMGKTHTVCEDYAFSRIDNKTERAVLSIADGCSSSPNSDIGARMITVAAHVCAWNNVNLYGGYVAAGEIARFSDMPSSVKSVFGDQLLDATLVIAEEGTHEIVTTFFGDGVVLVRRRDGFVDVIEVEMDNAPSYISYLTDQARLRQYVCLFGKRKIRTTRLTSSFDVVDVTEATERVTMNEGKLEKFAYELVQEKSEVASLHLFSDGAQSFVDSEQRPVDVKALVPYLLDIRVPHGVFLERAYKHMFNRVLRQLGYEHLDDFSSAAVIL